MLRVQRNRSLALSPVLVPLRRLGHGGEVARLPDLLQSAGDGHQAVGVPKHPGQGGFLTLGQVGEAGEIHPQLLQPCVEGSIYLPQVGQHLEIQPAAVIRRLLQHGHAGHMAELGGIGLQNHSVKPDLHHRPVSQGPIHRQPLCIQGIHVPRAPRASQHQLPFLRPIHNAASHFFGNPRSQAGFLRGGDRRGSLRGGGLVSGGCTPGQQEHKGEQQQAFFHGTFLLFPLGRRDVEKVPEPGRFLLTEALYKHMIISTAYV